MKKIIFAAMALVVCLNASAQKVIPVTGILTQISFDSLRQALPDKVAYLNELQQINHLRNK